MPVFSFLARSRSGLIEKARTGGSFRMSLIIPSHGDWTKDG
jgi:hypothetical protein